MKLNYKEVLTKEYLFIYLIYFFVFFAIGSLDEHIPLYFMSMEKGAIMYGVFISALSITDIILPTVSAMLAQRFGAKRVTVLYFIICVGLSVLLYFISNTYIISVIFFMISLSQTVFNYSVSGVICVSVKSSIKAKFFAVRDVFLYGSIALGLALSGILVNRIGLKEIISIYAFILIIPALMLILVKNKFADNEVDSESVMSFKGLKQAFKNKNFILITLVYSFLSIYSAIYVYVPFLAINVGIKYDEFLNSIAFLTVINIFISFFLSSVADSSNNKKTFFVIDISFDLIPIIIFYFTKNYITFLVALVLSALKDVFQPITFAYKYSLFDEKNGNLFISLLESITSVFSFILPVFMGILWERMQNKLFILGFVSVLIATLISFFLPNIKDEVNEP